MSCNCYEMENAALGEVGDKAKCKDHHPMVGLLPDNSLV